VLDQIGQQLQDLVGLYPKNNDLGVGDCASVSVGVLLERDSADSPLDESRRGNRPASGRSKPRDLHIRPQ